MGKEYLVRWAAPYNSFVHDTWEPEDNVAGCEPLLRFRRQLQRDQAAAARQATNEHGREFRWITESLGLPRGTIITREMATDPATLKKIKKHVDRPGLMMLATTLGIDSAIPKSASKDKIIAALVKHVTLDAQ
eukprot:SAG22_NODE_2724_length_2278_cov_1127.346489_2_plen_133_part_00